MVGLWSIWMMFAGWSGGSCRWHLGSCGPDGLPSGPQACPLLL